MRLLRDRGSLFYLEVDMVTYIQLREEVHYNSETGIFKWRKGKRGRKANGIAGSLEPNGYVRICIDYKKYPAHRLAWLYVHGYMPENEIDHINRVRNDNRICNLREVSRLCNIRNCSVSKDNTSGITGVNYVENWGPKGKWRATIAINKNRIVLGAFDEKVDAAKVRWEAEKHYNFPNCNTTSSAYEYLKKHGAI